MASMINVGVSDVTEPSLLFFLEYIPPAITTVPSASSLEPGTGGISHEANQARRTPREPAHVRSRAVSLQKRGSAMQFLSAGPLPHAQSRLAAFFRRSLAFARLRDRTRAGSRGIGERDKVERGCVDDLSGPEAVAERTEWNEGTSSSSTDRESELRRDDHLIANRAQTIGK
jgi:hypothetical protein